MGRILIVEDDPDISDSIADFLADEGHTVVQVGHGAEALAALAAGERPDLVLVDLMMPVMSGYELLARLAEDPPVPAPAVVVMSAMTDPTLPGGTRYLRKPIDPDALLAAIREVTTHGAAAPR